ncbi:MAG: NTP transferase domain-containing protein [Opitutae bacterium]|nr:NTP transferase domain-containing protein [Opitutae bacterium]
MKPSLLILAAGMGSRYGGLKQLDPVGPGGEIVLDYAVFDALRCGFDRVVFVIRREHAETFRTHVGSRYADLCTVDYAFQELDLLPAGFTPPAGRVKPWGTGHAVWCARHALPGPFAVLNADDFYGHDAFRQLGDFLRAAAIRPVGARPLPGCMVGFRLARTLSDHGTVSRGVCTTDAAGQLTSIVEHTDIARKPDGAIAAIAADGTHALAEDTIVSMNCWGLVPGVFAPLEREFVQFLERHGQTPKTEFYLPSAIAGMVASGGLNVRVFQTEGDWFGITYREDKPTVEAALRRLVAAGAYPASLRPATAGISRP